MKKNFFEKKIFFVIIFFALAACSEEPKDLTGRPSRGGDTVEISDGTAQSAAQNYAPQQKKKTPGFEDYPAQLYTGKISSPDFSGNPGKRLYRTVIGKSMKKGINFAGKYVIALWKCGDNCQESAIIDAETGKIFNGISTTRGLKFQPDSRLLIANPADSAAIANGAPPPTYYVWENENLREIGK